MKIVAAALVLPCALAVLVAAEPPQAAISNGRITAQLYLPDAHAGYYRGTRFDWSGVIYRLQSGGHNYYGPWYQKRRGDVRDFIYDPDGDIVAGPCSAITGPAEEYSPLGYDQAQPGGTFVKIGIGALRKPDAAGYDHYRLYDVIDPGNWSVHKAADRIELIQELRNAADYGYIYTKTVRLVNGNAEMVLEHRLKNTGTRPIVADVYNHNFLILDGLPPGPGYSITFPFAISTPRPPQPELARIEGRRIEYLKTLTGKDTVAFPIQGFGVAAKDYDFRVDSSAAAAGVRVRGDRPMSRAALWSIRSVVAVEPYINLSIPPGQEFTWNLTYDFYAVPVR